MHKPTLNARTLRIVLWVALFPLIAVGILIFFLGYRTLATEAQQTSAKAAEAVQSGQEHSNLLKIQSELAANSLAMQRAQDIVAKSASYQYQNQITDDIYRLAEQAGVGITGITFASAAAASTSASSSTGTASSGTSGETQTAAPAGMKTASATISLANPIPYDNFLLFLYSVEQNSTKMRIQSVSLSASSSTTSSDGTSTGSGGNAVNSDALTIEVYLDNGQQ